MSVYIIAIGGTGAKVAEAVSHLAGAGLYATKDKPPEKIKILFVDPDKGNGNVDSADSNLKSYQKCSGIIDKGIDKELNWWMQTQVDQFQSGLWSPFKDQERFRLRDVFGYTDYNNKKNQGIQHLFDVLYTSEERDLDLKEGFRGRPAVGSAIMTQLRQEKTGLESWNRLIKEIEVEYSIDTNNPPKIFLCGSIFGGTGASGFPTLGRLIANALQYANKDLLSKVKLGGLLMLPYFRFSSFGQDEKAKVYAKSEEFILKTETALRYYGSQTLPFDIVYLLGMPTTTNVESFSTGGKSQRNDPHILELYAALALQDFMFTSKPKEACVGLLGRNEPNEITWDDIPDMPSVDGNNTLGDTKVKLVNAAKFAYAWLVIKPDLEHAKQRLRDINFALKFYNRESIIQSKEWQQIRDIESWSRNFLNWLVMLQKSYSNLKLFNTNALFLERGNIAVSREKFPHLVEQNSGIDLNIILNRLQNRGMEGINEGTTGLAKALYREINKSTK